MAIYTLKTRISFVVLSPSQNPVYETPKLKTNDCAKPYFLTKKAGNMKIQELYSKDFILFYFSLVRQK